MEAVVPVNGTYRAVGVHGHYAVIRRKVENGITRMDPLGVVKANDRFILPPRCGCTRHGPPDR